MTLPTPFTTHAELNLDLLRQEVTDMEAVLAGLQAPERSQPPDSYIHSLVYSGVSSEQGRYWSPSAQTYDMPGDARFDFITRPTCLAVAILARCAETSACPNLLAALDDGCRFLGAHSFRGHGYEALAGCAEMLRIISAGGLPALIAAEPDRFPALREKLDCIRQALQADLDSGNTSGSWGEDERPMMLEILNHLAVLECEASSNPSDQPQE
jgi:hypothetical protein